MTGRTPIFQATVHVSVSIRAVNQSDDCCILRLAPFSKAEPAQISPRRRKRAGTCPETTKEKKYTIRCGSRQRRDSESLTGAGLQRRHRGDILQEEVAQRPCLPAVRSFAAPPRTVIVGYEHGT